MPYHITHIIIIVVVIVVVVVVVIIIIIAIVVVVVVVVVVFDIIIIIVIMLPSLSSSFSKDLIAISYYSYHYSHHYYYYYYYYYNYCYCCCYIYILLYFHSFLFSTSIILSVIPLFGKYLASVDSQRVNSEEARVQYVNRIRKLFVNITYTYEIDMQDISENWIPRFLGEMGHQVNTLLAWLYTLKKFFVFLHTLPGVAFNAREATRRVTQWIRNEKKSDWEVLFSLCVLKWVKSFKHCYIVTTQVFCVIL